VNVFAVATGDLVIHLRSDGLPLEIVISKASGTNFTIQTKTNAQIHFVDVSWKSGNGMNRSLTFTMGSKWLSDEGSLDQGTLTGPECGSNFSAVRKTAGLIATLELSEGKSKTTMSPIGFPYGHFGSCLYFNSDVVISASGGS
jgi:hypothetical protein